MMIRTLLKNKKGLTWGFIAKIIIWLAALGILIYILVKAGQQSKGIIAGIKNIF